MTIRTMAAAVLIGTLGLAISDSTFAQTALGGAKTPQNKIGGAAKPAPVLGGATIRTPSPLVSAKPGPTIATIKPGTPAQATLGTTTPGQTFAAGNSQPNPPPPTPNKGAKTANLKCASGVCTTRGVKP
jgi:hypothetical protein